MTRTPAVILTACQIAVALVPAEAAIKKFKVPDQFDGSWTIAAVTKDGPCSASTRYQVSIKDGDASIPGHEVDIDGGVSASGGVTGTIIQGSNKVPITGILDPKGIGSGTWQTMGGLIECTGSWSAKRAG